MFLYVLRVHAVNMLFVNNVLCIRTNYIELGNVKFIHFIATIRSAFLYPEYTIFIPIS